MALLKYVRYINKHKETCCHFVKLKSVIFLFCNLEAISSNFIPIKFSGHTVLGMVYRLRLRVMRLISNIIFGGVMTVLAY